MIFPRREKPLKMNVVDHPEGFTQFLIDPSYQDFPIIDSVMSSSRLIAMVLSLLECLDSC